MASDPTLRSLLRDHRLGRLSSRALLARLRHLPYRNLRFAKVDLHRRLRRRFPEVIYGRGKSPSQIVAIAQALRAEGQPVLITRLSGPAAAAVRRKMPGLRWFPKARMAATPVSARPAGRLRRRRPALVVTAGTGDIPVAEEAAVTLRCLGFEVRRLFDVGVAGLHRLLSHRGSLWKAGAIVVVAGMDGALPSVVSGLVDCPVIAVPTSVGYGASFRGVGPLLTMLNSCSPGVAVVNIDNGFGAGYLAALILSR